MRITFEETQVLVATALLLPAFSVLIYHGLKRRLEEDPADRWDPRLTPEHDWWSKEAGHE
jgi:hypothetical protein